MTIIATTPPRQIRALRFHRALTRAAIVTACVVIVGAVAAWAWLAAVESIGTAAIVNGGVL